MRTRAATQAEQRPTHKIRKSKEVEIVKENIPKVVAIPTVATPATPIPPSASKKEKSPEKVLFKLSLSTLRHRVVNDGKFTSINKYFDRYNSQEKLEIVNMTIEHMLKYKKSVLELNQ